MIEPCGSKIVTCMRSQVWTRIFRRFARQQDGAAAVEFAIVAVPFLGLLFAILETAMVFFSGQTLEATLASSARLILTGQAQTTDFKTSAPATTPWTKEEFKTAVCARLSSMFDCSKLYVSVDTVANFASADTSTPVADGKLTVDTNALPYNTGNPGDIVVVSIYYEWPIAVTLLNTHISNLGGDKRLLLATSVFRNEPYK
jgi:Flp pilus assembly protein TadG